jgi:(p)ppGpp synthase/HD superfamily hydrolase
LIERFGERVAAMVAALSKDKREPETQREDAYYRTLHASPVEVILCKLADLYDNLSDAASLPPPARVKTLARAQHALELFSPVLSADYGWALERFEQRIRVAVSSLGQS